MIAALLFSVVVALFLGAALRLSLGNLKANDVAGQRALFAAESGLRYVQARLASDYTWDLDGGLVVDTPELAVYEDRGNIVGVVRTSEGDFAQFRVRFNFQDDAQADTDGFVDPGLYSVDSPYVSVNNILGGSPRMVPRADGPGFSVMATSPRPYSVPAGTACVVVEGRYGPGLRSLSTAELSPPVTGQVTTRVLEAYLEADTLPGADSAAMSAGDMSFEVEPSEYVTLSAKDANQASRLRSRAMIEVVGGASPNLVSTNGETYTVDGSLAADASSDIQTNVEDTSTSFYRLEWDEVKKADSSGGTLAGGTYVIWDDGSLHHYDMSYSEYVTYIEANPSAGGNVVDPSTDLPPGMSFDTSDPAKPKLVISENVLIDGGSTDEFNIIPRKGVQEDPPDSDSGSGDLLEMATEVAANQAPGELRGSLSGGTEFPPPAGAPPFPSEQFFYGTDFTVKLHGDHWHLMDNDQSGQLLGPSAIASVLSDPALSASDQALAQQVLQALGGAGGGSMRELDLPSQPAALRADDVEIVFAPPEGESAILSANDTIRLGTRVSGKGGSITSAKDIRVVGDGDTALQASEKNGLTLYARGDVVMSGLKEVPVGSNNWEYKDVDLKGVVYSWGDIEFKLSNDDPSVSKHGSLQVQGALVAYGGDPAGSPGADGNGEIKIDAQRSELKYDPVYLMPMTLTPPARPLRQSLYNIVR